MTAPTPNASARPIATQSEAQDVITHLGEVMDALVATVEQETELVRAGRLREAGGLQQSKSDLARLYATDVLRLKANKPILAQITPSTLTLLQRRHDAFRALLQINLTVLATAHAVSESIIRGVSGELQRKAMPQTYGASGRTSAPGRKSVEPLAISRSL